MAKTHNADPSLVPQAMQEIDEALLGARSEFLVERFKPAGTLAIGAAVRATDLICDVELGKHSIAGNHRAAVDLLATTPESEESVVDLEFCIESKSDYNYHLVPIDENHTEEIIKAAQRLAEAARRRATAKGWL
jgi:hypothetical protein